MYLIFIDQLTEDIDNMQIGIFAETKPVKVNIFYVPGGT